MCDLYNFQLQTSADFVNLGWIFPTLTTWFVIMLCIISILVNDIQVYTTRYKLESIQVVTCRLIDVLNRTRYRAIYRESTQGRHSFAHATIKAVASE